MLTNRDVLMALCIRDRRNPLHGLAYKPGTITPAPMYLCVCDNCAHGRAALASELMDIYIQRAVTRAQTRQRKKEAVYIGLGIVLMIVLPLTLTSPLFATLWAQ